MATEGASGDRRYVPQLDGLRAVSVAAVAYSHWLPAYQFGVPFGAGVHLFFVLSGLLITRILLGLRGTPARGRAIGRFYLRRALRLFPAFYAVLALAWLAGVPLTADTWPWHAAYLSNVYIARQAAWQGHLSHFWSLAVEEQFYLVWPWLVVWAPARWLGPLFAATVAAGPLARTAAAARGLSEPFWALVPAGSADSLGAGALVAWTLWAPGTRDRAPRIWRWAAIAGLGAWLAMRGAEAGGVVLPTPLAAWRQVAQAAVFAWIVHRAWAGVGGLPGRVLSHPAAIAIGRISYGIYLVHAFAPLALDAGLRWTGASWGAPWPSPVRAAAAWGVTIGLAALLWRVVEAPAHRLKARL
ncbi:MAG: acyltransferase family protein [Vicinamibacterales bacterium]